MALNIPETDKKRVVVVGGGFAGLALLRKLGKSPYQAVLIDQNNSHQFQPLLYQVATAALTPGDIAFPFRKLLRGKKNIHFRMAIAQEVDAENKFVITNRGKLKYDYLVLAVGSTTNFFGMENIERCAMRMKNISEALEIRNRVLFNIEKAVQSADPDRRKALLSIVIVGGGASGVELAGAFAEMKRYIMPKDYPELDPEELNIYLVESNKRVLMALSEKSSEDTYKILTKRGVEVVLNNPVSDYKEQTVYLKDGRKILSRNLIWTSGVRVELPKGLEKANINRSGRIETDEFFMVKGYQDIFAAGDASLQISERFQGAGYPQLARVAIEQAEHLGVNLKRIAKGRELVPYRYINYPVMATVGRNRAFAEIGGFRLKGFIAWLAWAFVHIISVLGVRNKLNVLWNWFWNYITFDLPTRIITVPPKANDCESTDDVSEQEGVV